MTRSRIGIGHYDKRGNACLKFYLCGVKHGLPGLEYNGVIDTGFTGFIQLPIQHAFALSLPLQNTTSVTLADGSQTVNLTALATATLLGKTEVGTVILVFSSQEILIGMDFLRRFKRALVVSKSGIMLIDDEEFGKPRPVPKLGPAGIDERTAPLEIRLKL